MTEKGKLQKMILLEILPDLPQGMLIEALIEAWGIAEAVDFGMTVSFNAMLIDEKQLIEKLQSGISVDGAPLRGMGEQDGERDEDG